MEYYLNVGYFFFMSIAALCSVMLLVRSYKNKSILFAADCKVSIAFWGLCIYYCYNLLSESVLFYFHKEIGYNHYLLAVNMLLSSAGVYWYFGRSNSKLWYSVLLAFFWGGMLSVYVINGYWHPQSVINLIVGACYSAINAIAALFFVAIQLLVDSKKRSRFHLRMGTTVLMYFFLEILTSPWGESTDFYGIPITYFYLFTAILNIFFYGFSALFLFQEWNVQRRFFLDRSNVVP